jgi:guanylate kinase
MIILINAVSATGKSLLIKNLMRRDKNLIFAVSATTRTPRPGEIDGKHYHFLSPEQFKTMEDDGEFFETVEVYGNKYGTLKKYCYYDDKYVIFDLDIEGCKKLYGAFPKKTVKIMLLPPDMNTILYRLSRRKCQSSALKRIKETPEQLDGMDFFDYIIINDEGVDCLINKVLNILWVEKIKFFKPKNHGQLLKKQFEHFIKNHCICENSFNLNNFNNLYDTIGIEQRLKGKSMNKEELELENVVDLEQTTETTKKKRTIKKKIIENDVAIETTDNIETNETQKTNENYKASMEENDDNCLDENDDTSDETSEEEIILDGMDSDVLQELLDHMDDELMEKLRQEIVKRQKNHPDKDFHSHSHRKPMDRGGYGDRRGDDRRRDDRRGGDRRDDRRGGDRRSSGVSVSSYDRRGPEIPLEVSGVKKEEPNFQRFKSENSEGESRFGRSGDRGGFRSGDRGGFRSGDRGGFRSGSGDRGGFRSGDRGGFRSGSGDRGGFRSDRGGFRSGDRDGFRSNGTDEKPQSTEGGEDRPKEGFSSDRGGFRSGDRGGFRSGSGDRGGFRSGSGDRGGFRSGSGDRGGFRSGSGDRGGFRSGSGDRGGFRSGSGDRGGFRSGSGDRGGFRSGSGDRGGFRSGSGDRGGFRSGSGDRGGFRSGSGDRGGSRSGESGGFNRSSDESSNPSK